MNQSPRTNITDERFYTPRAQASTGRSSHSYGTPRTSRSASDESEYATPRGQLGHNGPAGHRHRQSYHQKQQQQPLHAQQVYHRNYNSHTHFHGSSSLIPPQYPARFSREYRDDSYGEDVESRGGSSFSSGIDRNMVEDQQDNIKKIFSYTRHGRVEEVDNLLLRGVPVDVRDDNGNSILCVACQNGSKKLVKLALRYGADINLCNFKGNTALHFCYRYGYAHTLGEYLKRKGADGAIRNLNGSIPEDLGGTEA